MPIRKFKQVRRILRASNFEHRVLNSNSCSSARNTEVEMPGFSRQNSIETEFCFHILVWHDLCHIRHRCIVGHGPPHSVNRGGQRQLWSPRCLNSSLQRTTSRSTSEAFIHSPHAVHAACGFFITIMIIVEQVRSHTTNEAQSG
jgi:hypothetical protein